MSIFGWFSAAKRAAPEPVKARYDAAQTTPLNQRHWAQADWLSADAALHPGIRRTLRVRSRYEAANNSYLAGMLSTLASDMIGTGPRLQLDVKDADDDKLKRVERAVEEWMNAIDLPGKLRIMRRARATDGESFALMQSNPALDGVQLDIKLIESDQVANPTWILELGAIDGLRLDDAGNVREWHIMRNHPGSLTWASNVGDWVPAERVLHWAHKVRPGQHRGVGEFVPALELFAMLRRYTLATVTAAETAADFAALIHTNTPGNDGGGTQMPAWETMPIVRGTIMSLPDQWDATQLKPEHPTTTYGEFEKRLINQIARALDMPYIVAAMDSSAASYSSMRGDYLVYRKAVATLRADLERHVLDRLLDAWLDEAALVPGLIPNGLPPVSQWTWSWTWDGFEHVDPSKEADAMETALRTHTTTLAAEYQKKGKDWRQELAQRAQEIAVMRDLGLLVDLEPEVNYGGDGDPNANAQAMQAADGHVPPKGAREEARRGLEWRREYGRGGTAVGVARARDIAAGRALSMDTVNRMVSYFARHEVDKKAKGWRPGEEGYPSAGRIAWALWGGDAGRSWANKVAQSDDRAEASLSEEHVCGTSTGTMTTTSMD